MSTNLGMEDFIQSVRRKLNALEGIRCSKVEQEICQISYDLLVMVEHLYRESHCDKQPPEPEDCDSKYYKDNRPCPDYNKVKVDDVNEQEFKEWVGETAWLLWKITR